MGLRYVVGPHRAEELERTEAARRSGRRLVTVVTGVLLLLALTLALIAAGPPTAAAATAQPAAIGDAAAAPDAKVAATADLLASLQQWPLRAPATTGYGAPSAEEDDVVIYNRADLYWEIHVSLTGKATPYQIGQQYARAMTRADWWWWKKVYLYLTLAPTQAHVSYGEMVRRALALKQTVSPEVRGYVEGMASVISDDSWGLVNENDCWVLNLFPDVCRPSMCSALGVWGHYTAGGKPMLGRNLDWSDDPILPTLNAVTIYHNGSKSFCSLGYIGLWEIISGFNPSGLYAGILDADTAQPYPAVADRHSYPMDLRTALETTSTVKDAAAVMQKNKYCFNHQIVLADKTRVGILENDMTATSGEWARKVRVDNTPLNTGITWGFNDAVCAVNSFVSKGNNSALFSTKWNADRWQSYKSQLKMVGAMTVDRMKDIISRGGPDEKLSPYNNLTTMMMVYQPTTRHLELFMKPRSGGLPKNPKWQSIDVDFGATMFGGRWVRELQPAGWKVAGAQVAPTPDGEVVAALQLSKDEGAEKAVGLVRFRADGRRRWIRILDPAGADDALLAGVAVTRSAIVVGATRTSEQGSSWLLARYTSRGHKTWSVGRPVQAGRSDRLAGVVCDGRGNVFAAGGKTTAPVALARLTADPVGNAAPGDWCVRKYSPAGSELWERVIASEDPTWTEEITGIARLDRTIVVTGSWAGRGVPFSCSIGVARISTDGRELWRTTGLGEGLGAPMPSGLAARWAGIAVCGRDTSEASVQGGVGTPATELERCVYRLDPATGKTSWEYAGLPDQAGDATAFRDVAVDEYGNVTAVGETVALDGQSEAGLVSWFDDEGTAETRTFVAGGPGNAAVAVAAGDRGLSYVAATLTAKDEQPGMATVCWQPGGVLRWVTFRNAPACAACDVAVHGAKVYTAGTSGDALVLGKYDTTTAPLAEIRPN